MKLLKLLFLASLLLGQIGGLSPLAGVVIYIHDILLAFLVAFSIKKIHRGKLFVPIALFIVSCLLSLAANSTRFSLPELLTGSLYLVRWTLYAALYFVVSDNRVDAKFWLRNLFAVGVGFGIIGLVQFFLYPDLRNLMYLGWDPHYYRLFSTLLDPNFMGIILVFTILIGFSLKIKHRVWFISGQLISFIALLLTYSRSSFLALGVAIVVWALVQKRWTLCIVLTAFAGLVLILPHGNTLNLLRPDSTFARVGNWQESFTMIAKAPVFGYGFDTLRYVRPVTGDFVSKAASGADSSLLFVWATSGLFGLAAYVYLLISMIRIGKKSVLYLACVAALVVHSLFVNSLFYPWVMIWMWVLTGAAIYDT